ILCSAGAPITSETAAFFYGLGFDMLITYGATETGIPTIGNLPGQITTNTCGKPYPEVSVKISETGEILIRTPYRMLGYFDDPVATTAAFDADGWFYSGDLGRVDEKGLVRILGRCKENIVLANGKKLAPDDIETAYANIDGVKEFVICGVPVAEGAYDEVHAFVIAEAGRDDSALAHLKARSAELSQNQKLADIHLVKEIPKTSLQKPKRFLLKQMILQEKNLPLLPQEEHKDIPATVLSVIARVSGTSDFTADSRLFIDLPIDSLGALDLSCEINDRCGVTVEHLLHKNMTVAELIACVVSPIIGQQPVLENPYPKRKNKLAYQVFSFGRHLIRGFYRVKINNDSVLPSNSGYIICANHVSNFDYLYLTLNFTKERFSKFCCMAKKELFRNNFFCKLITNIGGMIPVDRDGIVSDTMTAIRSKLSEKWGVLIHPEGTRSQTGQLGSFKNGAAVLAIEADVPIVPAYIKGGYEVFPCQKKLPSLFNWKKMCKYQVDVIYGEPIFPGGRSPEELMTVIKTAVAALATPSMLTTPQA
ncbi:MAG: AMP-binding protein, partial [Evtepia sp.]